MVLFLRVTSQVAACRHFTEGVQSRQLPQREEFTIDIAFAVDEDARMQITMEFAVAYNIEDGEAE